MLEKNRDSPVIEVNDLLGLNFLSLYFRGAFLWSSLVAIKMTWREGKIIYELSKYLFIMNQLATAKKMKYFPRTVLSEMDWLINNGKLKGYHAGLRIKQGYIFSTCQKNISGQVAYFRFTRVMEILKNAGWKRYLLTLAKWKILKRE